MYLHTADKSSMQTCVFTPPHETGILVAHIIPDAGSHDTRLGRESSWPKALSGTHFLQAADGPGAFWRPGRESGVVVAWECGFFKATSRACRRALERVSVSCHRRMRLATSAKWCSACRSRWPSILPRTLTLRSAQVGQSS